MRDLNPPTAHEEMLARVRVSDRFWCESDLYYRANRWEEVHEEATDGQALADRVREGCSMMDRTNTLLARVLADLTQLKAWAEADRDQSLDAGADAQAADDAARVQMLVEALDIVAGCSR